MVLYQIKYKILMIYVKISLHKGGFCLAQYLPGRKLMASQANFKTNIEDNKERKHCEKL